MNVNILFKAAWEGKVEVLERLLQENRPIRADIRLTSLEESVLHVATKFEQLSFVNELMEIDPGIARELNRYGFRPLDIAVIMGNLPIVKILLSRDPHLGRLVGKENRNALHYAAVKGRVEIINELLFSCPDCLEDITVQGETALHLAVKYYQFEEFAELVKWFERLSKESIINIQDGDGNTLLHLTFLTKQFAIVLQDSYDAKVRELLQSHGAVRADQDSMTITAQHSPQPATNSQPIQYPNQHLQSELPALRNWYDFFRFQMERDSPGKTRNAMLVVAALIATVSFQAGLTPSHGVFEKMGSASYIFLFFNSLGFIASIFIICCLTIGFPSDMELYMSLISMSSTYSVAVYITGREAKVESKIKAYTFLGVAFSSAVILRLLPWYWNSWRKRTARNDPTA